MKKDSFVEILIFQKPHKKKKSFCENPDCDRDGTISLSLFFGTLIFRITERLPASSTL